MASLSGIRDLYERAKTVTTYRRSDSPAPFWSPVDSAVPEGFQISRSTFTVSVSPFSTLSFTSSGRHAKGTLLYMHEGSLTTVETIMSAQLPDYDERYDQTGAAVTSSDSKEASHVKVVVEARHNSEELLRLCKIGTVQKELEGGIYIETPEESARGTLAGASISFHITFELPVAVKALDTLRVSSNQFRILFDPSLSNLAIANLELSTSDGPIRLDLVRVGRAKIVNLNRLDPRKSSLTNHSDLISGRIVASDDLVLDCSNGPISGTYTTTYPNAPLAIKTVNFDIRDVAVRSAGGIYVSNTNASITGYFFAKELLTIETQHGKVGDANSTFRGERGVRITTAAAGINGRFEVAKELAIKSSSMPIDAHVSILSRSAISEQASVLASANIVDRDRPDLVAAKDAGRSSFEPPSFETAVRNGAGQSTSRGLETLTVLCETKDSHVMLDFKNHPREIQLTSEVKTTGGGLVKVTHPKEFVGSFSVATGALQQAVLDVKPDADSDSEVANKKAVSYKIKKRAEIVGTITYEDDSVKPRNSTKIVTSGSAELVVG
ncbi:BZ3500_MvSof-1268-A1-R1_Chr8-1g09975 [Microbotryum saponariae]|uniref:BZ3500_MvSof-1268-A1-R1_Chr8-1g09975 protein n=1 Tax=Microbotryum saponariae TaxID=289078 RepID=A0A2X0KSY3_9BASI|nr:BZ3500_MvSof-1268-A1-R1_Chr8-1g09975 [Microbotryum saponariae]SDA08261.1 BZ3501_MvSof-1269-A2-R1_Chr8-1g09698 [Microbotryum saponariae]